MDRPGPEHERQARRDERAHDRAHPSDADGAVRLVFAQQHHERDLALADLVDRHERQPVAGGAEHELERAVVHERPVEAEAFPQVEVEQLERVDGRLEDALGELVAVLATRAGAAEVVAN